MVKMVKSEMQKLEFEAKLVENPIFVNTPFVGQRKLQWIGTFFCSLDKKWCIFVNNTDRRCHQ